MDMYSINNSYQWQYCLGEQAIEICFVVHFHMPCKFHKYFFFNLNETINYFVMNDRKFSVNDMGCIYS